MSSSKHPAGLEEDASTDVAEGPGGAFGSGLQGDLPRVSPRKRLLPSEDPRRAAWLRPPTLRELGSSDVRLGWSRICDVGGLWGWWSWEGRKIKMSK